MLVHQGSPEARPEMDRLMCMLAQVATPGPALTTIVLAIVVALGFASFTYRVAPGAFGSVAARGRCWSTLPKEWIDLYERERYVDVDPCMTRTSTRCAPYVWDAASLQGDHAVAAYLERAARFGIRSGVAVSLHDARQARIVVTLDAAESPILHARHAAVQHRLGDIMLLANVFHDLWLRAQRHAAPQANLSPRERECLELAARGMTSGEIGSRLGITTRTANFHFSNVIDKLGAVNRHQAIARAVAKGLI